MKINFDTILKDMFNKEMEDAGGKVTLRRVATEALMAIYRDENISGEEKFKRYQLCIKVNTAPSDLEWKAEEVTKLKDLIGKGYGPMVVGRAFDLLEGTNG